MFCNDNIIRHMSSSHQFAIMSLHAGQKNYQKVCANYLSHSAISSIDSGKGTSCGYYLDPFMLSGCKISAGLRICP